MYTILTRKRRTFCQFIISGLNQTQSAIKAGYSEKSAKKIGSQLMQMPEVLECIKELKELSDKHGDAIPVKEDVEVALLCKDPIQKLIELMNCNDDLVEMTAAKALLPYFYLQAKDKETPNKLGKKDMKEANAIAATTESKFSTLGNQLSNTYDHEIEE